MILSKNQLYHNWFNKRDMEKRYFIYECQRGDPPELIAYADTVQLADMKCREFASVYAGFGVRYSYQKNPVCTDYRPDLDDINYQPEQQPLIQDRIEVGDILQYPQLYGCGRVTMEVIARQEDTVTVTECWTAEDTGLPVSSTENYKIEKDSAGRERVNAWQHDNIKCYAVPELKKPRRKTVRKVI